MQGLINDWEPLTQLHVDYILLKIYINPIYVNCQALEVNKPVPFCRLITPQTNISAFIQSK